MNPIEYEKMAAVEASHWWFWALRDLIGRSLRRVGFAPAAGAHLLDAGCGTGANLQHLGELYPGARLSGFDVSELALEVARHKVPGAHMYLSDIRTPRLPDDAIDLVLSCDVLPAVGVTACFEGLVRLVGHLRPGGVLVLNLPAYEWLMSEHDLAFHQVERYSAMGVKRLFSKLGLEPAFVTYRICGLFPAVVISRLPSLLGRRPPKEEARSQVDIPSPIVNALFRRIAQAENAVCGSGIPMPWGSSVFAVGRKPLSPGSAVRPR